MPDMTSLNQSILLFFLNIKNQIIHKQTIFIGSLNASIVHPREIYREAVKDLRLLLYALTIIRVGCACNVRKLSVS